MKNILLNAVLDGILAGTLVEPISTADLKSHIQKYGIKKSNGQDFAENTVNCLLANTSIKNPGAQGYDKVLRTIVIDDGPQYYYVADPAYWILQPSSLASTTHTTYFSKQTNAPRLSR